MRCGGGVPRVALIWSRMSARTASSLRCRYTVAVVLMWMIAVITRASVAASAASMYSLAGEQVSDAVLEAGGESETRAPVGLGRVAEEELVQVRAAVLDLLPQARHHGTDENDDSS